MPDFSHVSALSIQSEFVELLACPQCHSRLALANSSLECSHCHASYQYDAGIPTLFPKNFDIEHLKEEQHLAAIMKEKEAIPAMRFNLDQWSRSKALNSLPFKHRAFDYVVSIDVIHHECTRLDRVLASFRDLLKPGGMLFLEDPNAWGMFQLHKSILMPRSVYRYLRSAYHRLKKSEHRPADYEFPTNVWQVTAMLRKLGFEQITLYPHVAYPSIGPQV